MGSSLKKSVLIICILFSITFTGCIQNGDDANYSENQFTASDGFEFAEKTARDWKSDAVLTEVYSKDVRKLDGKADNWWYVFQSVSTAKNNTDGNINVPWIVELIKVEITKKNSDYNPRTDFTTKQIGNLNITDIVTDNLKSMDSNQAALLAKSSSDVQFLLNNSDKMWVDYRLTNPGWTINVDSVEHDAYMNGIAVVVKIDVATNTVSSKIEGKSAGR